MSDIDKVIGVSDLTPEKFLEDYKFLCDKYQLQVVSSPRFVLNKDGSFSVAISQGIGTIPKEEPGKVFKDHKPKK